MTEQCGVAKSTMSQWERNPGEIRSWLRGGGPYRRR